MSDLTSSVLGDIERAVGKDNVNSVISSMGMRQTLGPMAYVDFDNIAPVKQEMPRLEACQIGADIITPKSGTIVPFEMSGVALRLEHNTIDINQQILVDWVASVATSPKDWIGLFKFDKAPNDDVRQYITYQPRGDCIKRGTVPFVVVQHGQYYFKYVSAENKILAMSPILNVDPQITFKARVLPEITGVRILCEYAKMSQNAYPKAWIGLFVGDQLKDWNWISFGTRHYVFDITKYDKFTTLNVALYIDKTTCVGRVSGLVNTRDST
jgi:hypothetical protein